MVHVAKEMRRQDFHMPLLIGGATTSAIHTAVKIAPAYDHAVVHVADASRAVSVVGNLFNAKTRAAFTARVQHDQAESREKYLRRRVDVPLVTLEEARGRKLQLNCISNETPLHQDFTCSRTIRDVTLAEMITY